MQAMAFCGGQELSDLLDRQALANFVSGSGNADKFGHIPGEQFLPHRVLKGVAEYCVHELNLPSTGKALAAVPD